VRKKIEHKRARNRPGKRGERASDPPECDSPLHSLTEGSDELRHRSIRCCRGPTPVAVESGKPQKRGLIKHSSGASKKGKITAAGENNKQQGRKNSGQVHNALSMKKQRDANAQRVAAGERARRRQIENAVHRLDFCKHI
jgi:hypothetical protein